MAKAIFLLMFLIVLSRMTLQNDMRLNNTHHGLIIRRQGKNHVSTYGRLLKLLFNENNTDQQNLHVRKQRYKNYYCYFVWNITF